MTKKNNNERLDTPDVLSRVTSVDPAWITGITDGDGGFCVTMGDPKKEGQNPGFRSIYTVSQNRRSAFVLFSIKKYFDNQGSVSTAGGNMGQVKLSARLDMENRIFPFFKMYPPQLPTKARDFEIMVNTHNLYYKNRSNQTGRGPSRKEIENVFLGPPVVDLYKNPNYIAGLIDADGSFTVSMTENKVAPQMLVLTMPQNMSLIEKLVAFYGIGNARYRFKTLTQKEYDKKVEKDSQPKKRQRRRSENNPIPSEKPFHSLPELPPDLQVPNLPDPPNVSQDGVKPGYVKVAQYAVWQISNISDQLKLFQYLGDPSNSLLQTVKADNYAIFVEMVLLWQNKGPDLDFSYPEGDKHRKLLKELKVDSVLDSHLPYNIRQRAEIIQKMLKLKEGLNDYTLTTKERLHMEIAKEFAEEIFTEQTN